MARVIAARPRTPRPLAAWLCLLAPACAACSFFAPSLTDYAQTRDGVSGSAPTGTSGADSGGSAGNTTASTAGLGGDAGSNTPGGGGGLSDAGEAGAPMGEAGWTGDIVVGEAIAQTDVVLQPVPTFSLPIMAPLTGYAVTEADVTDPTYPHDAPLYSPYNSSASAWWDNLVAEQTQARVPVVIFPSHGVYSLTATDLTGPDAMNPRRLSGWVSAVSRAGASNLFQAACYVDTPSLQAVKNNFHGASASTLMDLSVQTDWDDVIWKRSIKPWYDTIPSASWFTITDGPMIQFGPLASTSFKNLTGNLGQLLSSIATSFHDAYNTYPSYVLDASWISAEPSLSGNRYVVGQNGLLAAPTPSFSFVNYVTTELGTVLPGYTDPLFYQSGSPSYHDASLMVPRKTIDSYGKTSVTLETGLAAALANNAFLTVLQDFTDVTHWSGSYRSEAANWATPNEYLNLIRHYSDPQTVTLRLEAEGCDKYLDTTNGNSGGAFRRAGDLDVRTLTSNAGWAVTGTAAKEYVEFDGVDFAAGNYQFIAKYSTSGATSVQKRIQLLIDGKGQTPVIASNTANGDTFANTLLRKQFMPIGPHDLRVRFLDGLLDLDWLFVKKVDPNLSLKSTAGKYVSAQNGGGGALVAEASKAEVFEQLTFADLNGGSLQDGDAVYIQVWNGQYLSVTSGALHADHRDLGATEVFTVHNVNGGTIGAKSVIALLSSDNIHYLSVVTGGLLDASSTVLGDAQKFTVGTY